jgi:hypothetical protein
MVAGEAPPVSRRTCLDRAGEERRTEGDGAAGILQFALQGEEIGMAVEDARHGRLDGPGDIRAEGRLDLASAGAVQQAQFLDAVFLGAGNDVGQAGGFLADANNELAASLYGDTVRIEIGIEHSAPGDAVARLQAALGIVKPGMDDLGIARGGMHRDLVFGFQHDDFAACPGERAGRGEADHAGADDDHICLETVRHSVPDACPYMPPLAGGVYPV